MLAFWYTRLWWKLKDSLEIESLTTGFLSSFVLTFGVQMMLHFAFQFE